LLTDKFSIFASKALRMLFSTIVGQSKAKQRLINSVKDQRVSHAQLFLGPEGSGKLALAIAYAQYLNCRNRTLLDSCGVCPSCIKYQKLVHPDLHFIYPVNTTQEIDKKPRSIDFIATWRSFLINQDYYVTLPDWYNTIGIEKKQGLINAEDADEVNRTLSYKSYEAEYKVMIIWMVEKLNTPSANKLLKVLEEPPEKTLFLLIAENSDQIISTILSRTQLIKIPKIEESEMLRSLKDTYTVEGNKAHLAAILADGNFRAALDQCGLKNRLEKFDKLDVTDNVDLEFFDNIKSWFRCCKDLDKNLTGYSELFKISQNIAGWGREKQKELLLYLLRLVRSGFMMNIGNQYLVRLAGNETAFVKEYAAFIHRGNVSVFESEINRAIFHIERNINASIVFTDLAHLIVVALKKPDPGKA
jgi:DNA polymerase III subunit delta'